VFEEAGYDVVEIRSWPGGKQYFMVLFDYMFPKKRTLRPVRFLFLKFGVFLDRFFPFLVSLVCWVESRMLMSGLLLVYARKK
ncbi:MAG TPA: hypothetical protein VJ179_00880, partial [Patescibacteria group bacterium]|nr:hypothetical protein [Patescibacteria group bacterium]